MRCPAVCSTPAVLAPASRRTGATPVGWAARLVRRIVLVGGVAGVGLFGAALLAGPADAAEGAPRPAATDAAHRAPGPLPGLLDRVLPVRPHTGRTATPGDATPDRDRPADSGGSADSGRPADRDRVRPGGSAPGQGVERRPRLLPTVPLRPATRPRPTRPDVVGSARPAPVAPRPGVDGAAPAAAELPLPDAVGGVLTCLRELVAGSPTCLTELVTGVTRRVVDPVVGLVGGLLEPVLPGPPATPADPPGAPGSPIPPVDVVPPPAAPGAPGSLVPAVVIPAAPASARPHRPTGPSGPAVASSRWWSAFSVVPEGSVPAASAEARPAAESQTPGLPNRPVPSGDRLDDVRAGTGTAPASTQDSGWSSRVDGRHRTVLTSVPVEGRAPAVSARPG